MKTNCQRWNGPYNLSRCHASSTLSDGHVLFGDGPDHDPFGRSKARRSNTKFAQRLSGDHDSRHSTPNEPS
jgi:hypothetical protein